MEEEKKVKGAVVNSIINVLKEKLGEGGYQKVLSKCSPECRQMAMRKIYDSEWIADYYGDELMETADKMYSNRDWKLMRYIGYKVAREHFKGIYKVFVKFTSFKSILKRANVIWKKYFSEGHLEVLKWEEGIYQFEVLDTEPTPANCMGVLGWLDMFLEVYKVDGTAEHTECKLKGDKRSIFTLRWK